MTDVIACGECDSADLRNISKPDREGEYYCPHCRAEVDGTRRERASDGGPLTGMAAYLDRADADAFGESGP